MFWHKNAIRPVWQIGIIIFIAVLAASSLSTAWAQPKCATELAAAEKKYQEGLLDETIDLVRRCLEKRFLPRAEAEQALKLLSKAYYANGLLNYAEENLRKLLVLAPTWRPDPERDTPSFQRFANNIITAAQQQPPPTTPKPAPTPVKTPAPKVTPKKNDIMPAVALSALFPGLGQAYEKQTTKAILFGSAEVATLTAFFLFKAKYNDERDLYADRFDNYSRATSKVEIDSLLIALNTHRERANSTVSKAKIAFGVAAGIWALNILDSALGSPVANRPRRLKLSPTGAVLFPAPQIRYRDGQLFYSVGARIEF